MEIFRNKFILYLIILLGFVGGYFYYYQIGEVAIPSLPSSSKDLDKFSNLKVNLDVVKSEGFTSLQVYGDLPVSSQASGKADIFQGF